MRTTIDQRHLLDEEGRPAGGQTTGKGFVIHWQQAARAAGAAGAAFYADLLTALIAEFDRLTPADALRLTRRSKATGPQVENEGAENV